MIGGFPISDPGVPKLVPTQITHIYICIIYTPNLGLGIAIFDREREHGRFRGSSEGAGGSSEGSTGEHQGSRREH